MVAFHYFKELYDIFEQHDMVEAKPLLMKMQARYIVMCDENMLLRKQIRDKIVHQNLMDDLIPSHAGYWLVSDGAKQGPFCRTCYQNEKMLTLLDARAVSWHCPHCNTVTPLFKAVNDNDAAPVYIKEASQPCVVIPFSKHKR